MHLAAWLCSRVKFICRDRGGLPGGLLLFLADSRPVRGEAVRGGAGKGCYGKYSYSVRTKEIGEILSAAPIYEEFLKYEKLDSS